MAIAIFVRGAFISKKEEAIMPRIEGTPLEIILAAVMFCFTAVTMLTFIMTNYLKKR